MRLRACVFAICVLALVPASTAPALAQQPSVEELAERVEALEKKLATLQQNTARQISSLERQLSQAGSSKRCRRAWLSTEVPPRHLPRKKANRASRLISIPPPQYIRVLEPISFPGKLWRSNALPASMRTQRVPPAVSS